MTESRSTPPRGPQQPRQGQNQNGGQNAGQNPRGAQNPARGRQQAPQNGAPDDEDDKKKEERKPARISPQMLNAYPAMLPDDRPPFDVGDGWLEWADKKAAGLADTVFKGGMEDLQGTGATRERLARQHQQGERHSAQGRDVQAPDGPPRTPPRGDATASRGGRNNNGGGRT